MATDGEDQRCLGCWAMGSELMTLDFELTAADGRGIQLEFCESCMTDILADAGLVWETAGAHTLSAECLEAVARSAFGPDGRHLVSVAHTLWGGPGSDCNEFNVDGARFAFLAGMLVARDFNSLTAVQRELMAPTPMLVHQMSLPVYTAHCYELAMRFERGTADIQVITDAEGFALLSYLDIGDMMAAAPWYAHLRRQLADKLGCRAPRPDRPVEPRATHTLWRGVRHGLTVDRRFGAVRETDSIVLAARQAAEEDARA